MDCFPPSGCRACHSAARKHNQVVLSDKACLSYFPQRKVREVSLNLTLYIVERLYQRTSSSVCLPLALSCAPTLRFMTACVLQGLPIECGQTLLLEYMRWEHIL